MLTNVFLKTLRDWRRSMVGWSTGMVVLVVIIAAIWPSMRDMPNLDEFLASYPEPLRELFNIEAITTGAGFMNAELFSFMLPTLFLVFGISRGARAVAGEEENGTLEVLLVTPVSRLRVLLDKATALAVATTALGAVLFVSMALAAAAAGMGIAVGEIASGSLATVLLGIEYGWLALAIGAAGAGRAATLGIASTAAVAGYVLYVLGEFVEVFEPWQVLSPFDQALSTGPLGGGLPLTYLWMALAAAVAVAVAAPVFERRDIAIR